jgi:restriction system protein
MASVDVMTGRQFEEFLEWVFDERDVTIELTPATADRGADLLVKRGSERSVIQAKRHALSSRVGGEAVREAIAARTHYRARRAMVVTNAFFSTQALETADENDVELVDRDALARLLAQAQERRSRSPKDEPERVAGRVAVAPTIAELRRSLATILAPVSPSPTRSVSTTSIETHLRQALSEATRLRVTVKRVATTMEALETSFRPDHVSQAYELLIKPVELKRRTDAAVESVRSCGAALQAFGKCDMPTKYSAYDRAVELANAAAGAARASVKAVIAAGLDVDEDLGLARSEAGIGKERAEATRHLKVAMERMTKLREIADRAAQAGSNAEARRQSPRARRSRPWSQWQ